MILVWKTVKLMNRKGFTLIELLGVIVIIGLIIAGTAYGLIKLIDKSKEERTNISISSIKEAALVYANEKNNDEDYWKEITRPGYEGSYFCVTIEELQNEGLLDKNIDFNSLSKGENSIKKTTYVGIKKDDISKTNSNPTLLNNAKLCNLSSNDCNKEDIIYGICTGNIINETISVYTLKYDTQGGTTIASQTANAGSSVTVTTTIPTKTGNKFTNWNTEKDGTGTTYESGSTVVLNSNITLYAIWSYSVPIISCNNVYPDDEYAYSATNGSVRVKVTDDDGDLDKIYYNKSYYDPFDYNTTNSTFYITDAKTNMIRIYALDKLGHISSNQMPEWSSPTGENGIVYCSTNLDLAAPNTPLVSLLKNDDGSWNLSEMTNIKDIETDCCYKKAYQYPNCHSASIDRNVTEDQSCTITAYRTNPSRYAELKFYFFGEDWFGNYIKETGDMFEARKITGISGEDYYYMTEYNASGRTCSKKCSYTNASNCSCMSNAVKNEIYLVDKVGHKSKTLTINIVWK